MQIHHGSSSGKTFSSAQDKSCFCFYNAFIALGRQLAVDRGQATQTGTNVAVHSFSTLRGLHQMRKGGHWECKVHIAVIYENVLTVLYIA